MKLTISTALIILLIVSCKVQTPPAATPSSHPRSFLHDTTYFDNSWQKVATKVDAKYYRTFKTTEEEIEVEDRFIVNDQIQMAGTVYKLDPLLYHGKVLWYHENGKLQKSATYNKGAITGIERQYFPTGSPRSVFLHSEKDRLAIQIWDDAGNELLKDGSGIVDERNLPGITLDHKVFKDSVCIESFQVRSMEKDTIYFIVDTEPEYESGMSDFYRTISSIMEYPVSARRMGTQGRVYVQFIVTQSGEMEECKIVKGLSEECDREVLRVMQKMKRFKPGLVQGRPVKTRLVLPVIFKLT